MKRLLILTILIVLALALGCGGPDMDIPVIDTGVDPLITWDPPTTNCAGEPLTGPVTYNIYAAMDGPIPTQSSTDTSPCGVVEEVAPGFLPLNAAPLSLTPNPATGKLEYHAVVPNGTWWFGVTALYYDVESGLSAQAMRVVENKAATPQNLEVHKAICDGVARYACEGSPGRGNGYRDR